VLGFSSSVYLHKEFLALITCSIILPFLIYRVIWLKRSISRITVLYFGVALIVLAGIDIFLLRVMAGVSKQTISLVGDVIFNSELSLALYMLPALFAGTGINMVSHVLIHHLSDAEKKFDRDYLHG
jgi:hypothetical protein